MEPVDALITHQPSSLSGGGAGNRTAPAEADTGDPAEIAGVEPVEGQRPSIDNPATSGAAIDCDRLPEAPSDHRAELARALTRAVDDSTAAGDLAAARVAAEALVKLLGSAGPNAAPVADLAAERARRGAK